MSGCCISREHSQVVVHVLTYFLNVMNQLRYEQYIFVLRTTQVTMLQIVPTNVLPTDDVENTWI